MASPRRSRSPMEPQRLYPSPRVSRAIRGQPWSLNYNTVPMEYPMPSDDEIAKSVRPKPITVLCHELGITEYDLHGSKMAKLTCAIPAALERPGSYIAVASITPEANHPGEGKTTVTFGLVQALNKMRRNAIACIRQPNQAPIFAMRRSCVVGGGYCQVLPTEEFNLHFTGDMHAVTAANNLISAALDARVYYEKNYPAPELMKILTLTDSQGRVHLTEAQKKRLEKLGLADIHPNRFTDDQIAAFVKLNVDPATISHHRVLDSSDRFLREVTIDREFGDILLKAQFRNTIASELMSMLALSCDLEDLNRRIRRMVVAFNKPEQPYHTARSITCDELDVSGAVTALLKYVLHPTLIQTLEGAPVLVHCAPSCSIGMGNSSVAADKLALELVGPKGFVVTETDKGADVGFEKFMNIKCRSSRMFPDCVVLVASIRGLRALGKAEQGPDARDDVAVEAGLANLEHHIQIIKREYRVRVVVAINVHFDDSEFYLSFVQQRCLEFGADGVSRVYCWARGTEGAEALARVVIDVSEHAKRADPLLRQRLSYYHIGHDLEEKIRMLALNIYNAGSVIIDMQARRKLTLFRANGFNSLPVCIAKTPYSISDDPQLTGVPSGYPFHVKDAFLASGAGFIVLLTMDVNTMPELPIRPSFYDITLDTKTGQISGLI